MPGAHTFYDGSTVLEPIATYYNIPVDKINFVLCMFSSLPLAYVYKRSMTIWSRQTRALFPLMIGVLYYYFCFGRASKHLLANCLLNYGIMCFSPTKYVHKLVFGFSMSYLLFIHFYRWLILTKYCLDITGPMMVAVQKITTLAFSLHDGKVKKKDELTEIQRKEAVTEIPSLLDYLSYILNFQTALTGPVNFYSDYVAFLDGVHVVPNKEGKIPSPVRTSIRKTVRVDVLHAGDSSKTDNEIVDDQVDNLIKSTALVSDALSVDSKDKEHHSKKEINRICLVKWLKVEKDTMRSSWADQRLSQLIGYATDYHIHVSEPGQIVDGSSREHNCGFHKLSCDLKAVLELAPRHRIVL
ncbi:hypothetical protein KIN20_007946 [Parelaphostrongylus tenuis]|uniref:Uncharacterized protein n=1 Tax=Parelaphostrongylus tenuis TaxID=148309 RepID=A0AAD5M8T7_PARTN|nr:hypothetical protein KIN20_007946 [Parelaphostrongylus tenuis]